MKNDAVILSEGHLRVEPSMADVRLLAFGETGQVRLIFATERHQAIEPSLGRPPSATTLAVDMDEETAMKLLLDLHNLSNTKGWPLAKAITGQDGFQTQVSEPRRK